MYDIEKAIFAVDTAVDVAVTFFPNVFVPKKSIRIIGGVKKEVGELKYGANFGLKPDSQALKDLKALALALAKAKWPERDIAAAFKGGTFRMPWKLGDAIADKKKEKSAGKDVYAFMRGLVIIKASSTFPVSLAYFENGNFNQVDISDLAQVAKVKAKFYHGTEALFELKLKAYDGVDGGLDGVTAYLVDMSSLNKGKRLSTQVSSAERFKNYVGHQTDVDPTGGETDDEI